MNTQSIDISLYQKGDIALEDIYKKFKNCFMRYAGEVLSSEFYAEDVVQDVFIGLFQQTNYFVSEAAALKYNYSAIYNRYYRFPRIFALSAYGVPNQWI
mgnify:CR=1 FL=1